MKRWEIMESNFTQDISALKKLPNTWSVFDFGDVFTDISGGNKKFLKSDFLTEGKVAVVDQGKDLIAGYTNEEDNVVKGHPPYIVFGDHTRKFKFIDFPFVMGADGTKVFKVKETTINNEKYLFHFLNSLNIPNTGYNRHYKYLKSTKIPLPPLPQQQKIANLLDAADALRQNHKKVLAKYDELTQALFLDMFGDPVKNEKGWETKTIEQLVSKNKNSIKRGPFGGALKKEIFVNEGYLVYEQYHALNNDFSMARYFIDDKKFEELKGFEVKPKDIIISCSGVYLGKLAIVPENAKKGIINQALLKVTIDESKMTNDFFVFHFSHKNFREKYFDANRGAGIPNFPPMLEFKKFPFISPPMILQTQFAERVAVIEAQKTIAQKSLEQLEELFSSLLQKAFKGELE